MIEVSHITKTYRVAKRDAGFINAFHSLFHREYEEIRALDDIRRGGESIDETVASLYQQYDI